MMRNTQFLLKYHDTSLNSTRSDFIDPLSVILILALLKYKPIGTKLRIGKSVIRLVKPTLGSRFKNTFCRSRTKIDDLRRLYQPLIHACNFFLEPKSSVRTKNAYPVDVVETSHGIGQGIDHENTDIRQVFEFAMAGLRNLKQTYKNSEDIVNMIHVYINIIDRTMHDYASIMAFIDDLFKIADPTAVFDDNATLRKVFEMKKSIYEQFNSNWSPIRISIVTQMFKELNRRKDTNETEQSNMMKSIEALLCDCNQDIRNLLRNLS